MKILTLPNILTITRIAIIPVIVVAYYLDITWSNLLVTFLFVLAAITDWLDGFLARRMNETSRFGAFLDPVADKLMVVVVLVLVVDRNPTSVSGIWITAPAIVIIGREIAISALREWMSVLGAAGVVAVSWLGKIKTTAQMLALGFLLYADTLYGYHMADWGLALLYLAAILTFWSMLDYLKAAYKRLSDVPE